MARAIHLTNVLVLTAVGLACLPAEADETNATSRDQNWSILGQNTDVVQAHPSFPAQYSGPQSLDKNAEAAETIDWDLFLGLRLWQGAEFHFDGLVWQGFGLSHTVGVEAFPSAEAYKVGAPVVDATLARVFIRQTIGLGGEVLTVEEDPLHLRGEQDAQRIVLTAGEMSVLDIFDNNAYAGDPQNQFMNWAFVGNEAWDYPANSLGYISGFAAELYEPPWALRYGFFQMPEHANGLATDPNYLEAWGMVLELERHFELTKHPGAVRLLAFLNRAHMGNFEQAVDSGQIPAIIPTTTSYHSKYGFCLNLEQELAKGVGAFMRLGWNDGNNQSWAYADVDRCASMGLSVNGGWWNRANDTFGIAGVVNALSGAHRQYFEDGGLGILAGDGTLNYGLEKVMETYYNVEIYKRVHFTADYQFIIDPAYNRARGPVSVFGGRIHWDF